MTDTTFSYASLRVLELSMPSVPKLLTHTYAASQILQRTRIPEMEAGQGS